MHQNMNEKTGSNIIYASLNERKIAEDRRILNEKVRRQINVDPNQKISMDVEDEEMNATGYTNRGFGKDSQCNDEYMMEDDMKDVYDSTQNKAMFNSRRGHCLSMMRRLIKNFNQIMQCSVMYYLKTRKYQ